MASRLATGYDQAEADRIYREQGLSGLVAYGKQVGQQKNVGVTDLVAPDIVDEPGPWTALNISKAAYEGDWRYQDPNATNQETGLPYGAESDPVTGMATTEAATPAPIYDRTPTETAPPAAAPVYGEPTPAPSGRGYMDFYDLISGNAPSVQDPYTLGLLEHGLERGADAGQLPLIDFDKLTQQRMEALETSVWGAAGEEQQRMLDEIAKRQQRFGKLSSSATMQEMRQETELYRLQKTEQQAQGALGIYSQMDEARAAERAGRRQAIQLERQRVLESSMQRAGLDQNQQLAIMQMSQNAYQFDVTEIGKDGVPKWMKELKLSEAQTMNPETGKPYTYDIAIDRLSEAIRSFDLTNANDMIKFNKTLDSAVSEGLLDRASRENIIIDQLTSAENIVDLNNTAQWNRLTENLKTMVSEGKLSRNSAETIIDNQLSNAFKIADMQDQTVRDNLADQIQWNFMELDMSLTQQWELYKLEITENQRQFNITTETGKAQFEDNLKWIKKQFNLSQTQTRDFFYDSQAENMRQFDLTRTDGNQQFRDTIKWAKDEFNLSQSQSKELFIQSLQQDKNQFDLAQSNERAMFASTLNWAKDEKIIDTDLARELSQAQINEAYRQFNITSQTGKDQFKATMEWAISENMIDNNHAMNLLTKSIKEQSRQFDLSRTDQREQFKDMLEWAKDEFDMADDRLRDLSADAITENSRQFDLTRMDGNVQFHDSLMWAKKQFGLDDDRIRDIAQDAIDEQAREYNLTRTTDIERYATNLQWAKDQYGFDDLRVRQMQNQMIREQARQFDVSRTDGWDQWQESFNESMRQFDADLAYRMEALTETLAIQRDQMTLAEDQVFIDSALGLLNNVQFNEFMRGAEADTPGVVIAGVLDVLSGDMNMEEFAAMLDEGFDTDVEKQTITDIVNETLAGKYQDQATAEKQEAKRSGEWDASWDQKAEQKYKDLYGADVNLT